ncbi:tetratricopeptide repeat protein [Spirosoma sp. HMF4905]|uniref:Tetratricopeptide repeat protein n=1 Tax=Spirosoma arboris TaxID=2682092 RepID=A0A7K1SMF2_9BACT|nr:tetratricopeptide repeat protein [Spirosoma arboris]MVM34776.1 tetratricopeptide repeat protein [Spirosoma arboris]
MKKSVFSLIFIALLLLYGCNQKTNRPSAEQINELNLKRGQLILCGSPSMQLGTAEFKTSCSQKTKGDFDLAIKLLHSFEYDEAEKAFAKVIDQDPQCVMGYWGIAMANFHPLWTPPTEEELQKGARAIQVARSLETSEREADYLEAIGSFYQDWQKVDHQTRCLRFEKGMENVYKKYPDDKEAAVFYALALDAAATPDDQSFSKQKKAGDILQALYPGQPNHPGIVHYLIHTYDYPELAQQGLSAARKYASIAPSSAHALHMPSHIFTRLGLWNECIESNLASVSAAQCYAQAAGIKGHWDEELHGLDYLVYAYLQKGDNASAKKQWDYLKTITEVQPVNFKVAYAFAAIPSRYVLENKRWAEAASLQVTPVDFPWENFPWQAAIIHFTRSLGSAHIGNLAAARTELTQLDTLRQRLTEKKDTYKANQVAIQITIAEAWLSLKEGNNRKALMLMQQAADREDKMQKHPVTPGEVLPARELLGDMLLQLGKPTEALAAYETDLQKHPKRLNALYGAGLAAKAVGAAQKANAYFSQWTNGTGHAP